MNEKKVLIIGGTGFIGSQLCAKLSPLCDKICVLTIQMNKNCFIKSLG